jgi:arylsulfatase A-like enzyme
MLTGRRAILTLCLILLAIFVFAERGNHFSPDPPLTPNTGPVAAVRNSVRDANVVIVVLDAARADHLGCYGYPRPTTPNIDHLAAESTVFANHFCQMPLTAGSTTSLFTGLCPDEHGVVYRASPDHRRGFTLASAFARRGFRTVLFSANPSASPAVGVGTDFQDAYHRTKPVTEGMCFSPEALLLQVDDWLQRHRGERFLTYIHFLPPHTPYAQPSRFTNLFAGLDPPGYREDSYQPGHFEHPYRPVPRLQPHPPLPEWINLYDANLSYGDAAVGWLLDLLRDRDLLDSTLLVITSDHGEAFGEHGFTYHAHAIHTEVTHIPLLLRFPGPSKPIRRAQCLSQTIDLLPTLCDLFSVEFPSVLKGRSLLPVIAGEAERAGEFILAKSYRPEKYVVRDARHALILFRNPAWDSLYDLTVDPGERRSMLASNAVRAEQLHQCFLDHARSHPSAARFLDPEAPPAAPEAQLADVGAEVGRQLTALGYLE